MSELNGMSESKQTEIRAIRQRVRRLIAAGAAGLIIAAGAVSMAGCQDTPFNPKVSTARSAAPAPAAANTASTPAK